MAELISRDIFHVFNWQRNKITNCNWKCVEPDRHHTALGTHPTDAVWYYEEPYEAKRTYIQTDLKSYARKTMSKAKMQASLASLAKAVECAPNASEWRGNYYIDEGGAFQVIGLLFIYNHDGDYDDNFPSLLQEPFEGASFKMKAGTRLMVMGPKLIWELNAIASHIKQYQFEYGLGLQQTPFYPEGKMKQFRHLSEKRGVATTIDALFSNVISFKVKPPDYRGDFQHLHVYYRGGGKTKEEFLHLIDSFFRYQTIACAEKIFIHHVSTASPNDEAARNFERARNEIATLYDVGTAKLDSIEFETLVPVKPGFSATEIGMRS
ncbi:MAG: hypothetical protein IKQ15_00405 [Kiritimatiellae bacterium]|nr:hypothetical protein [Kiritimatiellia bacterium]